MLLEKKYSDAFEKVRAFQENSQQEVNPFSFLLEADILYNPCKHLVDEDSEVEEVVEVDRQEADVDVAEAVGDTTQELHHKL